MLLTRYVAWMLFPLTLCLELLLVGLLFLWFGKRQRVGRVLVTLATVLLVLFSWGPFGDLLVRPLESTYPALHDPAKLSDSADGPIKWVVVLGAGFSPDPDVPASSRPGSSSLTRLVEGVRIHRQLPGSKVIVLVGEPVEGDDRVRVMGELTEALGVKSQDALIVPGARDTAEEVDAVSRTIRDERFVLVTSASHMPRAMRLCRDKGMSPVAAPTGYQVVRGEFGTLDALPSPNNLGKAQTGFREFLASAWNRIAG
jgi:uncharacterized SAM-binding protein YcdF (DUF218 family)